MGVDEVKYYYFLLVFFFCFHRIVDCNRSDGRMKELFDKTKNETMSKAITALTPLLGLSVLKRYIVSNPSRSF